MLRCGISAESVFRLPRVFLYSRILDTSLLAAMLAGIVGEPLGVAVVGKAVG